MLSLLRVFGLFLSCECSWSQKCGVGLELGRYFVYSFLANVAGLRKAAGFELGRYFDYSNLAIEASLGKAAGFELGLCCNNGIWFTY